MTKNQRNYFSVLSVVSIFVMAVTILFTSGKATLKTPFARATGDVSSITFARSDEVSASGTTFKYKKTTPAGNDIYLVSTGGINRATSSALASVPSTYDIYTQLYMRFYKNIGGTSGFSHQAISSISVVTSAALTVKVQTSSDGVSFKDKGTLNCSTSGATLDSFTEIDRYVCLTVDSRAAQTRNITGITITYECQSNVLPYELKSFYKADIKDTTNRDTYLTMDFDASSGYGRLVFHNLTYGDFYNNYRFEWVSENLYKIYYVSSPTEGPHAGEASSGSASQYQEYCLFPRNNMDYNFYNLVSVFDNRISLVFHTTTNTSLKDADAGHLQNQRTDITVLQFSNS